MAFSMGGSPEVSSFSSAEGSAVDSGPEISSAPSSTDLSASQEATARAKPDDDDED